MQMKSVLHLGPDLALLSAIFYSRKKESPADQSAQVSPHLQGQNASRRCHIDKNVTAFVHRPVFDAVQRQRLGYKRCTILRQR